MNLRIEKKGGSYYEKSNSIPAAAAMMASLAGGALSVQAAAKTDLTIAVDADVDTLHSTDYSTTVEHDILSQIYDTLMYMNPDGSHDPEPRIAESL